MLFYKETILCQDNFIFFIVIDLKLVYAIHASKVLEGKFLKCKFLYHLKNYLKSSDFKSMEKC